MLEIVVLLPFSDKTLREYAINISKRAYFVIKQIKIQEYVRIDIWAKQERTVQIFALLIINNFF